MLTMNWKDLQYRKPKPIKKKVKQKKGSQVVSVMYPLNKTNFSASNWEEYQEWIKKQKKLQQSQEKAQKPSKSKKVKNTKTKVQKAPSKPKKAPTLKEQYLKQLESPLWIKKRNMILERDHHQCVLCGSSSHLQVHHKRYSDGKRAWEYPNAALVTLCRECHQKVHSDPNHILNPYKNTED